MATSTAQTVATVQVYDYLLSAGSPSSGAPPGLVGRKIKITLVSAPAQSVNPVTGLLEVVYANLTDQNGFWQANLIPNNKISPAGTYYLVEREGYDSYLIQVTDVNVPAGGWQSSAIRFTPQGGSGVAGYTLPGGTTVQGSLAILGPGPWIDITHPSLAGGALGNGVVGHDAASFNAAVTAVPAAGGTIIVPPTGPNQYIAEATFAVTKANVTVMVFGDVMIKAANNLNADVLRLTASNITVLGGIVDGNYLNQASGRGVVVDAPGAAQFLSGAYLFNLAIQNCKGECGAVVATGAGSSVTVTVFQGVNATVGNLGLTAVVRPGGGTVDMTTMRDCVVNITVQHGILSSGANRTNVSGCSLLQVGVNKVAGFSHGIAVDGNSGTNPNGRHRLTENWIVNPYDAGIEVADAITGAYVAGNTSIGAGNGAAPANTYGFYFGGGLALSVDCVFVGNTSINSKGNGFQCSGPSAVLLTLNVRFIGNTSTGNGLDGILVQWTDTFAVIGNTCQNNSTGVANTSSGIDLNVATGGKVIANDCQGKGANQSRGINERGASNFNLIALNDVRGNVTAPYILLIGAGTRCFGNLGFLIDQRTAQVLAFAATLTPDATLGEFIAIGALTANLTLHVPINVVANTFITYLFTQDGTGGRTITWDAGQRSAWQPAPAAAAISSVSFFYDGASWWQIGSNVVADQFGNAAIANGSLYIGGGANAFGILTKQAGANADFIIRNQGTGSIIVRPNDAGGNDFIVRTGGTVTASAQIYPGAEALGGQTLGGLLHSVGVPSNANGNNNDRSHADNGITYFKSGGVWIAETSAPSTSSTPANPALTASLVGVMMGLSGAITPARTGKVLINITGDMFNSVVADGVTAQIRTGTGAAPGNGTALAGTTRGNPVAYTAAAAANKAPFSISVIVTGLTLGTAIWIDLGVAAVTGGNASVENITITAVEI